VIRDILESDILELRVEIIVLGNHLVVFKDLLRDHLLRLLNVTPNTAGSFFSIFRLRSF
jgi:hypothetical protein